MPKEVKKEEILVVDDEHDICSLMVGLIEDNGMLARQANSAYQALQLLAERVPNLLLLDIWLDDHPESGMQVLDHVTKHYPALPVVVISGHGTVQTAVQAIKRGAYDYLEKPFKSERLLLIIERAIEAAKLKSENSLLRKRYERGDVALIGSSPIMSNVRNQLQRVASTDSRVLITGGSGSGKELAARTIHRFSSRRERPFVILAAPSLVAATVEEDLFGKEDGMGNLVKMGLLDQANGGTLLLDEVSDMNLDVQGHLYRVLIDQKFVRLNGTRRVEVDVRIMATSSANLAEVVAKKTLREDLYHRLSVVPIDMPSLNKRIDDIPELIEFFVEDISRVTGLMERNFAPATIAVLQTWNWGGNIRQLRNLVERLLIMTPYDDGRDILSSDLPDQQSDEKLEDSDKTDVSEAVSMPIKEARETFERSYLLTQLRRFGGNISRTAEFIGMQRSALHRKLRSLSIDDSKH